MKIGAPFPVLALNEGTLGDIEGRRYVAFWASWSAPSLAELADLEYLMASEDAPPGLTVVAINVDASPEATSRGLYQAGYTGESHTLMDTAFRLDVIEAGLPRAYVLDAVGRVTAISTDWSSGAVETHLEDGARVERRLARRDAKRQAR